MCNGGSALLLKGYRSRVNRAIEGGQHRNATGLEVRGRLIHAIGHCCRVGVMATWYPDDHPLPCASKKDTVFIQDILSRSGILDTSPSRTDQSSKTPLRAGLIERQVPTPTNSCPVEFETLAFEFRGRDFEIRR